MEEGVKEGSDPGVSPDWNRERKRRLEWAPSRSLLGALRAYQKHRDQAGLFGKLGRFIAKRRVQLWCVVTGADIPCGVNIAGGLVMPHPNGVVIHRDASIGANCMIMQQVTLGQLAVGGAPRVGDEVYIGAGAKVLGPIKIGRGAAIGANAVVLEDVPEGATAVGVPARTIRKRCVGMGQSEIGADALS